jgi:hypothetical protein
VPLKIFEGNKKCVVTNGVGKNHLSYYSKVPLKIDFFKAQLKMPLKIDF